MKVNIFFIGPPRIMTTKIISLLSEHPQFCVSTPKESKFFSLYYSQGKKLLEGHYPDYNNEPFVVYSNPIDCNMDYVADRIYNYNPDAKIIMGLRDPILRAISHYGIHRYNLPMGRVCENIWDEFDRNYKNFNPRKFLSEGDFIPYCNEYGSCYVQQYFECSLYFNIYKKWFEKFPNNMHIYSHDDFKFNFLFQFNKILDFVGAYSIPSVDSSPIHSISQYRGSLDYKRLKKEFIERYPTIYNYYVKDLKLMGEVIGSPLNQIWEY